jgi:hypothetical protein
MELRGTRNGTIISARCICVCPCLYMCTYMNVCILVYVVQLLAGIYAIHKDLAPFTCVHGLHASKQYLCYTYWLHTSTFAIPVCYICTRGGSTFSYTYMLVAVARATNGERKSPRMISNWKTRIRLNLCFNKLIRKKTKYVSYTKLGLGCTYVSIYVYICFNMFQSNVKGVQNTEHKVCTEDVRIGCSLSVHVYYKLASTIYFEMTLKWLMFM